MPVKHWASILGDTGGTARGAGAFVTHCYVLTANHCVSRLDKTGSIEIGLSSGGTATATLVERVPERDLALLRVTAPTDLVVNLVEPSTCDVDAKWTSPYSPSDTQTALHGNVTRTNVDFQCIGGAHIPALQLLVDALLGTYSGYSGSPVICLRDDGAESVVGMLVEQVVDRIAVNRSSNVLFAAMIRPAMAAFGAVDLSRLALEALPRATSESGSSHGTANAWLSYIKKWADQGVISTESRRALEVDVVMGAFLRDLQ